MVGSAGAALTGLLFVAVELNRDDIVHDRDLRVSAAETLMLLMLPVVTCILLLTPDQATWALGTELIALAVATTVLLLIADRRRDRAHTSEPSMLASLVDRRESKIITPLFLLVAGVTHLVGHGGGLYWVVPAILFAFLGGVVNAWIFLVAKAARRV
jgi:modulator of FtsH protease